MNYMKYNRTFVMLEEQTREFSTREAPVKGYLKVETGNNKGALRCVVQNLRYYDRGDYIYKLILFGKKREQTIHAVLGGLILNRSGNGETYFRFNPQDVDGKGNCYHDFSTAIVAAASGTNKKEPLHPVLKGVMRTENHFFTQEEEHLDTDAQRIPDSGMMEYRCGEEELMKEMRETQEPVPRLYSEPEPEPEPSPIRAHECEPSPIQAHEYERPPIQAHEYERPPIQAHEYERPPTNNSEYEPVPPPIRQWEHVPAEKPDHEPAQALELPRKPRHHHEERTCFNSFYNESLLEFCGYICQTADHYEEVMPFDRDLTGARWKKVLNIEDLPVAAPGAHYFCDMYKHYLFGAKPGKDGYADEFYIAIPGRFSREEQPDGGRSGFVYWQPVAGAKRDRSSYGYWIVAIDAGNGDILEVSPAICQ